jgi:hypothetical protein
MSKDIYLIIGLLCLLIAGSAPEKVPAQSKVKSLCGADEQTIWSCATVKNKIASVCASKDLAADKGYVQYRFGLLKKIELEFPQKREGSQKAFKYSRYTRPLVTMLTLSFENGGVFYEIHDDDNSEEKPPVRAASIDITIDAKESSVVCKQPTFGSLMKLEDIVPRDEEK